MGFTKVSDGWSDIKVTQGHGAIRSKPHMISCWTSIVTVCVYLVSFRHNITSLWNRSYMSRNNLNSPSDLVESVVSARLSLLLRCMFCVINFVIFHTWYSFQILALEGSNNLNDLERLARSSAISLIDRLTWLLLAIRNNYTSLCFIIFEVQRDIGRTLQISPYSTCT